MNLDSMPSGVAMRLSESPCRCVACRRAGKVAWLVPADHPHHYEWQCSGHALARIKLGRYFMRQKAKAAVKRPFRNSTVNGNRSNELSVVDVN
jgi:hypothetical protein